MVLEPIIALVLAFLLSLGVRAYMRWFHSYGARSDPFEAWCATQPVVFAAKCSPGHERDVYDALRDLFASQDGLANRAGAFPWQHYVLSLDYRHLPDDVVGLVITACRPIRGDHRPRDVSEFLAQLGGEAAHVDEVWFHGQFHGGGRPHRFDRDRTGWRGTLNADGTFDLESQIGEPEWLVPKARAAP